MPSYEYTQGTISNNVVNQSAQISTGAKAGEPTQHTNKYGRVSGVATSGIDILTGNVTYVAAEGSGYGYNTTFTGVPVDKEVDAQNDPYATPARLTVLGDLGPASYNHRVLG